jgi:hypothetical protein
MAFWTLTPGLPQLEVRFSPTTNPYDTPVPVDITPYVRRAEIEWGREPGNDPDAELGRFETVNVTLLLDNRNRTFDPSYAAGPFYGNLDSGKWLQVRAQWPPDSGTIYNRFTGYLHDELPQQFPDHGYDAVVPVSAVGPLGLLALDEFDANFTRSAELTSDRATAVLDHVAFPAGSRSIDTGVETVTQLTDPTVIGDPFDHLTTVGEAEGGQLFDDPSGNVVFERRHYRNINEAASRWTFGPAELGYLPYVDVDVTWGGRLWNEARLTPASGNLQTHTDAASVAKRRRRVFTKSLPISVDNAALSRGQFVVEFNKDPQLRCRSMSLAGASLPVRLWPAILSLKPSHHITVIVEPPDASGTYTFHQYVEHMAETITASSWANVVQMSRADLNSYWELGTAGKSELGVTTRLAP